MNPCQRWLLKPMFDKILSSESWRKRVGQTRDIGIQGCWLTLWSRSQHWLQDKETQPHPSITRALFSPPGTLSVSPLPTGQTAALHKGFLLVSQNLTSASCPLSDPSLSYVTSVTDPLLQTLSLIFNSLPTPFGLYTLDSSCGCWTVLPAGCCLPSPLLHNYLWGSVPMHIHTQLPNPCLCQNHRIPTVWGQKGSHWLCPNTKWLMSPFRTWRILAKSYELGIQRKPALQPVCSNWNLQKFRDPTEMPQRWLQRPGRGTNKMGCRHQTPFTQSSSSLICFACLPLPYDFISRNEIKFCFFVCPLHYLNFFI